MSTATIERLPIMYDVPNKAQIVNAFHERRGQFEDSYYEFVDICLNNLTWAAHNLLMWQDKPLRLAPFQSVILETLWNKTFPILLASRGAGKTFLLAIYAVLRAMLCPGSKIVIVGAGFRQAKFVFEYIEQLYKYSPILRECCPQSIRKPPDQIYLWIGDSVIRAIPLGNGEKVRGMRATHIISDEFASINPEVFQVVVRGFASVAQNPIEAATKRHKERKAIEEGWVKPDSIGREQGNQIVYTGTANYQFNHFYKILKTHEAIILNKIVGNALKVNEQLNLGEEDALHEGHLDYRDYAIIRIPYQALPESYMDERQIAQARVTMPRSLFQMEYECKFPTDSDGFFKRSLINAATPGHKECGGRAFGIEIVGQSGFEYVMGVDPARKTDNFAISILQINPSDKTCKNIYCYSMRGKSWPKATRKIRELLKKFNIVRIAMDAGGGGSAVEDLLQDEKNIMPGEQAIWRYDDDEQRRFAGRHILDMVNFTPTWIGEANYGMAADIEHKRLLFPYRTINVTRGIYDDTVEAEEEVWENIEEQIKEICMIVVSSTKTGIQHFDTPELPASQQGTLKTYQRKDRYSALLLSTYAARSYLTEDERKITPAIGGWIDLL